MSDLDDGEKIPLDLLLQGLGSEGSSSAKRTVAIVGAGYSGTLTAVNILRRKPGKQFRIVLVERRPPFGRGLAYGTWDDNLLLNVPAGNMSALADDPGHFVTYCRSIDPNVNAGSFVSRRIYGDYLEDTLMQAERDSNCALERIACEAVAVRTGLLAQGYSVGLADGRTIQAERVVLALGHFEPNNPPETTSVIGTDVYISNPWDIAALDRVRVSRSVALLGTGQTAIDTLFRMTSRGDGGKFFLVSRRGLLPRGHRPSPKAPAVGRFPPYLAAAPSRSVRALAHAIRREVAKRSAAGGDWRDVINELRPHTAEIWYRLPVAERRRFLNQLAVFWEVHRHRLAPAAHLRLERMLAAGGVEVMAAHIVACEKQGDEATLIIRRRGTGAIQELSVGAIVNCTGPNYDTGAVQSPLVVQLRDEGYLRQDALKLGLELDDRYQVVDRQGWAVPNLFYIGPMLKAKFWEAIAVPELRNHSARLAELMFYK